MVRRTRCRVSSEIRSSQRFRTRDTVVGLTPASRATSRMLGRREVTVLMNCLEGNCSKFSVKQFTICSPCLQG